uniref:Uncharacterized protein n=1 Tax=Pristionchus pacificus TaxID=54126 RepID=A0A2A6CCQ2_PRIPA|eukprot:PDM75896.1 hypothetical protein PRIPAC_43632 [Pristionchus pacificus]
MNRLTIGSDEGTFTKLIESKKSRKSTGRSLALSRPFSCSLLELEAGIASLTSNFNSAIKGNYSYHRDFN